MNRRRFRTIPGLYLPTLGETELKALSQTVEAFKLSEIRFTPSNQLAVADLDDQTLLQLTAHLKTFMQEIDKGSIVVLSCHGCNNCAVKGGDVATVTERVKQLSRAIQLPAKCKIAVAGCSRCCTMPFVRDLGLIPTPSGWQLIFGGNGGGNPRIGDIIAEKVQDDILDELITRCLTVYRTHAAPKQRTSRFIESFGLLRFKQEVFSQEPQAKP